MFFLLRIARAVTDPKHAVHTAQSKAKIHWITLKPNGSAIAQATQTHNTHAPGVIKEEDNRKLLKFMCLHVYDLLMLVWALSWAVLKVGVARTTDITEYGEICCYLSVKMKEKKSNFIFLNQPYLVKHQNRMETHAKKNISVVSAKYFGRLRSKFPQVFISRSSVYISA